MASMVGAELQAITIILHKTRLPSKAVCKQLQGLMCVVVVQDSSEAGSLVARR